MLRTADRSVRKFVVDVRGITGGQIRRFCRAPTFQLLWLALLLMVHGLGGVDRHNCGVQVGRNTSPDVSTPCVAVVSAFSAFCMPRTAKTKGVGTLSQGKMNWQSEQISHLTC